MQYRQYLVFFLISLCFTSTSRADDKYRIYTDRTTKNRCFTFQSSKGNVRFNHDLHQTVMTSESCIPCHKTETPIKGYTMTRFDQRFAHAFCKGCHKEKSNGPVECHECHKENK